MADIPGDGEKKEIEIEISDPAQIDAIQRTFGPKLGVSTEEWGQIKAIFAAAFGISPEEGEKGDKEDET